MQRNFTALVAFAVLAAGQASGADVSSGPAADAFSLVVMDPLAAPLSCPCVEGYAQRKYEVLGERLEQALGVPVTVTFAESLAAALKKDHCDHADLIIGKDSVVRSDAGKAGYSVTAVGRLTDKSGDVTQHGLIVVRSADPAQQVTDLKGYRILFGPQECDEKFAAPRELLKQSGVQVVDAQQAEISTACSDGACKIIEWGDSEHAAAVISSYAAPLLEGCGTINKGDLRVVGETGPVPFITAFLTDRVAAPQAESVRQTLRSVAADPKLLIALETMLGFVEPDEEYLEHHRKPADQPTDTDAAAVNQQAWCDFLGPTRDGRVAWLPESLSADPTVVWRQPLLRPGMGGIAATSEYVVIGDRDPSNNLDAWRCYSARDGTPLWTIEYPALGTLDYDNLPRATPVIDGDRVFLMGAFGDLVCVELATGLRLWETNLRLMFAAEGELVWGTCSTPLLVDGVLIVNPGAPEASLAALDAANGEPVWQSPGGRHAYASPRLMTLGGVRQVVAYDKTSAGGWDPATGRRLWTLTPPNPGDFNVPTPALVDGRLLLVSENNGARLHAFDDSGCIIDEPAARFRKLQPDMSTPVVAAGRVFCVKDQLYCLDAKTLEPIWQGGRRRLGGYAPILATDHRLLTTGKGGELLLIDALADGFRVIGACRPFSGGSNAVLYGCPALVGTRLYLRGAEEIVCCDLAG
ncbi:Outer membrane protein assembly factor BamB [Posidoniimonas polymericola]|uniref:Outer membrane protein assembly factor BamB n=1 Tax=Posidoniimonas polymericola TaxID=2528002 RepID=A0A5C5YQW0_9BACT|nr:PQQ-binding-like beta-propeller repeat protein [Posidoniimonas polymericola]TWT77324.1 Outer membrane protein assembly factor BamB [Posidoniimonas polymericola]